MKKYIKDLKVFVDSHFQKVLNELWKLAVENEMEETEDSEQMVRSGAETEVPPWAQL